MPDVKVNTDCYAPTFDVEIQGQILSRDEVISMDIDESIEKPAMFTLSLNEMKDIDTQKLVWLDNKKYLIMPGNEVFFSFGYPALKGKFMGTIKGLTPSFPSSGVPTLKVEGYDYSHDLQKSKTDVKSKFKDKKVKYSDVAKEIAENNLLDSAGVENTVKEYPSVKRRKNEKDYALLKRLAGKIGYEFFVREEILYFRKPKDNKKKDKESFIFEFGKNIISFNPRLTTAPTVNEVKVTGWNQKTKKPIEATAKISEIISNVGIQDFDMLVEKAEGKKTKKKIEGRVVGSEDEAKNIAVTELKRANNGFISGTLECIGNPKLRPGVNIEIKKLGGGDLFNGMYYIKGARHSFSDSGYTTTLEVRRCL